LAPCLPHSPEKEDRSTTFEHAADTPHWKMESAGPTEQYFAVVFQTQSVQIDYDLSSRRLAKQIFQAFQSSGEHSGGNLWSETSEQQENLRG
jgi:hypothetical protein